MTLPNIYVSWSTSELRMRLAPWNGFSPPVKVYITYRSNAVLLLWILFVSYHCLTLVCVVLLRLFLVALWPPAGERLMSWLLCLLCFVTFPNMFWSPSELRARLAPWNWFKPSSKIFYWPFQGGSSFVDLLCFFLSCVCYAFVRVCLFVPYGHLLGKGWPLGSRLWCLTVSLSLSHWYPGSGVVLDCIDSWSLQSYLLQWDVVCDWGLLSPVAVY